MKKIFFILPFLLLSFNILAQGKSYKYATIEFVGDKDDNTRTYIGKVKKGNPNRLIDYLQQSSQNDDNNNENFSPKEYHSKKDRKTFRHLSDMYKFDEKKFKKNKKNYNKKYFEEKKRVYIEKEKRKKSKEKDSKKFSLKKLKNREKIPKTKLSKQYKIKGKRIRKGQKLKYREGNISLIIKYKVREDKMVREYVTVVNTKVVSGFKYYLNFYGSASKRRYYITQAP